MNIKNRWQTVENMKMLTYGEIIAITILRAVSDTNRFIESWKFAAPWWVVLVSLFLAMIVLMVMGIVNWFILGLLDYLRRLSGTRFTTVITDPDELTLIMTVINDD